MKFRIVHKDKKQVSENGITIEEFFIVEILRTFLFFKWWKTASYYPNPMSGAFPITFKNRSAAEYFIKQYSKVEINHVISIVETFGDE